jgi:hypothetical protein
VTPFESSISGSNNSGGNKKATAKDEHAGGNAGDGDTSTTGTMDTSKTSSVGRPTNLDEKKCSTNDNKEKNDSDLDADQMDFNGDDIMTDDKADAQASDCDDDDDNVMMYGVENEGRKKNRGILNYFMSAEEIASLAKCHDEPTEDGAEKEASAAAPKSDDDSSDDDLLQDSAEVDTEGASNALVTEEENPHKEADEAKEKSRQVLKGLTDMLNAYPNFCSESRKDDWLEEINQLTKKSSPQTVFGVLGNTGV